MTSVKSLFLKFSVCKKYLTGLLRRLNNTLTPGTAPWHLISTPVIRDTIVIITISFPNTRPETSTWGFMNWVLTLDSAADVFNKQERLSFFITFKQPRRTWTSLLEASVTGVLTTPFLTSQPWGAVPTCVLRLGMKTLRPWKGQRNLDLFRWKLEFAFPKVKFEFSVLALNKGKIVTLDTESKLTDEMMKIRLLVVTTCI